MSELVLVTLIAVGGTLGGFVAGWLNAERVSDRHRAQCRRYGRMSDGLLWQCQRSSGHRGKHHDAMGRRWRTADSTP